jgi:hypothetical protein
MRAELIEMLLRHVEALLGIPHESLIGGREEMVFWFVFDERARCTRASHFGSLDRQLEVDSQGYYLKPEVVFEAICEDNRWCLNV